MKILSATAKHAYKHTSLMHFYNNVFYRKYNISLDLSSHRDVKIFIPMFFRHFSIFTLTCKIRKMSKKQTINSTIWLEGVVSKTRFYLCAPRFSKAIKFSVK